MTTATPTIMGRKLESSHISVKNKLTEKQLVAALMQVKGATFATLVTFTELKVNDENEQGHIFKRSAVNVTLNHNYQNSVNNQRGRETADGEYMTEFVASPRRWGARIDGTPLVTHKGKFYLTCKIEKTVKPIYYRDYQVVNVEDIRHLFPPKSKSTIQKVDKPVIVRDYKISSLIAITLKGETFLVD